ncbi:hypothetical protein CFOL_v3_01454 [Cephalotus follicularis]|uniref:Uncharacterized protein n=1 Tax=Cephalotus follicularis TaxID=3775 RepID=A0A1Q3AQA4_CEPFO|nr:hypothetical protein CFOL_v3_01454 [Cephalotus follicularis]
MGISKNDMFEKDRNSMEFNFLVTPTLEFEDDCQIKPLEDIELIKQQEEDLQKQKQEEEEEKCEIPSKEETKVEDEDDNDGFKTPTSLDQRIPAVPKTCPPAPRKRPSKRKDLQRRRIFLDLPDEIDSSFPQDLDGMVKKVRL